MRVNKAINLALFTFVAFEVFIFSGIIQKKLFVWFYIKTK